jgi:hypothetical protein
MVWFTSLLGLPWITTSCLVYFWAFYKLHVNVRIWFKHCSRLTLVNPKPFIVVLLDIKGWTPKFNIIIWNSYHYSNNPHQTENPLLVTFYNHTRDNTCPINGWMHYEFSKFNISHMPTWSFSNLCLIGLGSIMVDVVGMRFYLT